MTTAGEDEWLDEVMQEQMSNNDSNSQSSSSSSIRNRRQQKEVWFPNKRRMTHLPAPRPPPSVTSVPVTQSKDHETPRIQLEATYRKQRYVIFGLSGAILLMFVPSLIMSIIAYTSTGFNVETRVIMSGKSTTEPVERNNKSVEDENKRIINKDSNLDSESSCIPGNGSKTNLQELRDQIEYLQSQNINLTNKHMQYKNTIVELATLDLYNVEKNLTEIADSDCGGIITIPFSKTSYLLYYKLNSTYAPNENCLWTLENTSNFTRRHLTITVKLISHGFKGNTGLFAYNWNRNISLASEEITSRKAIILSAEGIYLSFTSDETSTGGTGFLVRITVTQSELKNSGFNLFFRNCPGSYSTFSNYARAQISITISANIPMILHVKKRASKENMDLVIYEIQARGKFQERGRLHGNSSNYFAVPTVKTLLVLFVSDIEESAQRFRILWNKSQD